MTTDPALPEFTDAALVRCYDGDTSECPFEDCSITELLEANEGLEEIEPASVAALRAGRPAYFGGGAAGLMLVVPVGLLISPPPGFAKSFAALALAERVGAVTVEPTIAERIANQFPNPRVAIVDGVHIDDVIAAHEVDGRASRLDQYDGRVTVFADGSAIVSGYVGLSDPYTTRPAWGWDTVAQNDDGEWVSCTDIRRSYGTSAS